MFFCFLKISTTPKSYATLKGLKLLIVKSLLSWTVLKYHFYNMIEHKKHWGKTKKRVCLFFMYFYNFCQISNIPMVVMPMCMPIWTYVISERTTSPTILKSRQKMFAAYRLLMFNFIRIRNLEIRTWNSLKTEFFSFVNDCTYIRTVHDNHLLKC